MRSHVCPPPGAAGRESQVVFYAAPSAPPHRQARPGGPEVRRRGPRLRWAPDFETFASISRARFRARSQPAPCPSLRDGMREESQVALHDVAGRIGVDDPPAIDQDRPIAEL